MVEEVPVELADQAVVEVLQVEGSTRWTPEGWLRLSVGVLKRIVPTDPEYPERVNGDLGAAKTDDNEALALRSVLQSDRQPRLF